MLLTLLHFKFSIRYMDSVPERAACSNFQSAVKPQIIKNYSSGDFQYLHKLIINTSNYSLYLLFLLSLPVFAEIPFILKIWLGIVPEYTSVFVRLTLIIGLLECLKMPMNTSIHATGNIKIFQVFEGTTMLMIVPVAYIFLRLGKSPVSVFVVKISCFALAQIVRCYIVCPAIKMSSFFYIKYCLLKCFSVISIPSLIIYLYKHFYCCTSEWQQFIITCFVSFFSSGLCIYYLGVDQKDRNIIVSYIRGKLHFRKHE